MKLIMIWREVEIKAFYRVSQKIAYAFGGLWIKRYVVDIKTEISNYQSKANLNKKIIFGKIKHLEDLKLEKYL